LVDQLRACRKGSLNPTYRLVGESERGQLRALAEQLFASELGYEKRLEIAVQMCGLLDGSETSRVDWIPPPVRVLADAEIA
jgi:hypothetical protein